MIFFTWETENTVLPAQVTTFRYRVDVNFSAVVIHEARLN